MNAPAADAARGDVGCVPDPVPASRVGDDQPQRALIGVGRDCLCGFPLVWVDGLERCAVYGEHRGAAVPLGRDLAAPGAALVDLVLAVPQQPQSDYQRAYGQRRRRGLRVVS